MDFSRTAATLALGKAIESLTDGYYLVYDLGGGSFDCTAVEIQDGEVTVLAEGGLSALGGMDIDDNLRARLGYTGPRARLRIAKEQLDGNETFRLPGGFVLTSTDVRKSLEDLMLMDQTLTAMATAFAKAEIVRRGLEGNVSDLRKTIGRSESLEAMGREVHKVLVVGGPTRMPYFSEELKTIFGADKVVTADDLTQNVQARASIGDPTLTALSHGACYMQDKVYIPRVVDRVPAQISLSVSDYYATEVDILEPFERFSRQSLGSFEGREIIRRVLYDFEQTQLEGNRRAIYWVTVTSPDGEVIFKSDPLEMEMLREGYTGPRADRISLILDPLGGVKVRLGAGRRSFDRRNFLDPRHKEMESVLDVFSAPPWQPTMESREPDTKKGRVELRNGELTFIWN